MQVFLLTFALMLFIIVAMAVGYIFQKKELKGSCGGISALGMEKVCDCDEPCDKRKKMLAEAEKQQLDVKNI